MNQLGEKTDGYGKNCDMLIAKFKVKDPRARNKRGFSKPSKLRMRPLPRLNSFDRRSSKRKGESLSKDHGPRIFMPRRHEKPWH